MAHLARIAVARVHHDHRMQKKPDVAAVSDHAEPSLALGVPGEIEFCRILDASMPCRPRAATAVWIGGGRERLARYRLVVQKTSKALRRRPIAAEPAQAGRALGHERVQETGPLFLSRSSPNCPKSMPCIARPSAESLVRQDGIREPQIARKRKCVSIRSPTALFPLGRTLGKRGALRGRARRARLQFSAKALPAAELIEQCQSHRRQVGGGAIGLRKGKIMSENGTGLSPPTLTIRHLLRRLESKGLLSSYEIRQELDGVLGELREAGARGAISHDASAEALRTVEMMSPPWSDTHTRPEPASIAAEDLNAKQRRVNALASRPRAYAANCTFGMAEASRTFAVSGR